MIHVPRPDSSIHTGGCPFRVGDALWSGRLIQSHLEKTGAAEELAGNGEEALAAFEKSAVDLILVDLKVGQSDGCEVIRSTRHREAQCGRPRTRISALTVSVLAGDAERCLEMGMDGHLPKTVRKRISARRFLADR